MARKQEITECGFTPTDALHVLGRISLGNTEQALAGAEIMGRELGMTPRAFAEMVVQRTEEKIENLLIDYVIQHYWGKSLAIFISSRNDHPVLGVDFSLKIPLIGIGAAARHFLPAVAARLSTSVAFPKHCEVGNALGAAMICAEGCN